MGMIPRLGALVPCFPEAPNDKYATPMLFTISEVALPLSVKGRENVESSLLRPGLSSHSDEPFETGGSKLKLNSVVEQKQRNSSAHLKDPHALDLRVRKIGYRTRPKLPWRA